MQVQVVDYRPAWAQMFADEQARIAGALRDALVEVVHVGSTAVNGLAAKPVIDIMPGVASLAAFEAADGIARLQALGYIYRADYTPLVPQRRYFVLRNGNPEHPEGNGYQLHLVAHGGDWWERHIAFRDYLRTHPHERDAYGAFKQRIAPRFTNTQDYSAAKDAFIQPMEARALAWYRAR